MSTSFIPDTPTTEEILAAVLESPLPRLPPPEQRLGATTVSWWELDPGEVYIHAEGGTPDDRHYASTLVAIELEPHGFRRAQFDLDVPGRFGSAAPKPPNYRKATDAKRCDGCKMFDQGICWGYGNKKVEANAVCDSFAPEGAKESSLHLGGWVDIMAKAKRLIQSGQVQLLRNGFNYIVGHVIGDHGDYETEISRDDPSSRAITGWQCSCPWDQYAWQRTRKWKKFEGRPCAHVMALYWKALSTPMDEQLSPDQAEAMGTGQRIPAPAVPEHAPGREPGTPQPDTHEFDLPHLPRSFGPEGDILQGDQQQLPINQPPDALGGPPGPAQAPLSPPPGPGGPEPAGILPPFPGEQQQIEWAGPGTTPGGGVSPPGAVSVPGAKPQSPFNPLNQPGTYSKVAGTFDDWINCGGGPRQLMYHGTNTDPQVLLEQGLMPNEPTWSDQEGDQSQEPGVYLAATPDQARIWGNHVIAVNTQGLDLYEDPYSDAGPGRAYYSPNVIDSDRLSLHDAPPPARQAAWMDEPQTERCPNCSSPMAFKARSEIEAYKAEEYPSGGWFCTNPNCYTSRQPGVEQFPFAHPDPWMDNEPGSLTVPERWGKTAADFQAPQVVRLKNAVYGIAEGPVKGQYGDGEYREVPEGQPGEVQYQDPTTGWVECIFPLDDSGPHEPFHVRTFVEPSDIEPTNQSNAFIRRKSSSKLSSVDVGEWIKNTDGQGPWEVVDVSEGSWGRELIVRVDANGDDASRNEGMEGVDWEYVYIPEAEAIPA